MVPQLASGMRARAEAGRSLFLYNLPKWNVQLGAYLQPS